MVKLYGTSTLFSSFFALKTGRPICPKSNKAFSYIKKQSSISNHKINLSKKKVLLSIGATALIVCYGDELSFYTSCLSRLFRNTFSTLIVILDYKLNFPMDKINQNVDLELKSNIHKRCAHRIYKLFDKNGGLYIKLGQHVVSLGYVLPVEWVEEMKPLLDKSINVSSVEEINTIIKEEFNVELDDMFEEFDQVPLGTASLAQVHLAKLRADNVNEARVVAVKVQHYKVEKMSEIDQKIINIMCLMINTILPKLNINWMKEEIKQNLPKELDFRIEAENMEKSREILKKEASIKIPKVYFYSKRVICMEYVDGARLDDTQYMLKHNIDKDKVSLDINKTFFKMILKHGWMHCDPHTGNVMVKHNSKSTKGYDLYILDHGLYRQLDMGFRENFAKLYMSIVSRNMLKIKENCIQLGALNNSYLIIWFILTGNMKQTKTDTVQIIQYLPNLFEMLNTIPRDLIYVFKTFDLLRLLHNDLNCLETNMSFSYSYIARECQMCIYKAATMSSPSSFHQFVKITKSGIKLICVYFSTLVFDLMSTLGITTQSLQ